MRKKKEDRIQAEAYTWFHNTFPQYRGLLCYNLNNSKNEIAGNQNRSMGLQKGRADMTFYFKGKAYFLEFKTDKGTQQKVQKDWMLQVMSHSFEYHLIRSKEYFIEYITQIINNK